jgi:hypothetical protein
MLGNTQMTPDNFSGSPTPTTIQGGGYPAGTGPLSTYAGVTLRGIDPDEFATNQLNELLRSDNPLLQGARGRAMDYAAARGAGADSASYGYNAEQAMGQQLIPLAQQNAAQVGHVYDENQNALDAALLEREQGRTQTSIASMNNSSAMSRLRAQNDYDTRARQQNREWAVADQGTQARAQARSQFFGNMESAMFSDPSFWRDPQGTMGAFQEYGANFDSMFNSMFPEYSAMENAGGVPGVPPGGGP